MWGIIAFVFGLLYGWVSPGRQNKARLMMNGLWIGLIVALVIWLIGLATGAAALGFGGGLSIFLTVIVLTLLFVLGAFLGDLIESGIHRNRRGTV